MAFFSSTSRDEYGIRTGSLVGAVYALGAVKTLGQFCSISRALDVLGERWSLLVVREVLMGSHRFGESSTARS
jgi:DNA-binding HxlR family transcriptional regulator